MTKRFPLAAALFATVAVPVMAQDTGPMPLPVQQQNSGNASLPANTEITLRMNQEVTTRGRTWSEGDTFHLTVADDVVLGDYVVIPEGSRALGRITWMTNRGAFGKSGKMDIELEHVEVSGRRIRIDGTYRQEGEGATLETIGGVLLAGVFAGFITGRSARIPQGRELVARTESPLELAIPSSAVQSAPTAVAPLAPRGANVRLASQPAPVEETPEPASDPRTIAPGVYCATCQD